MILFLLRDRFLGHKTLCWGANNKSRLSYDNLNRSQWVSGFAMIAREEQNIDTKNAMLDYLSELMEDANDFSWQSAKHPM